MHYDVQSDFNIAGGLPKGSARQALDAEIAGEGGKVVPQNGATVVILSNGDQVAYTPPPEKLVMPDLSNVKSLRHYFGQRSYMPYPAWLYHTDGRSVLVHDHKEAAEYGVVRRQSTPDERNRYGIKELWDWESDSKWRPNPWVEAKFDPKHPGSGKTVMYTAPDPKIAQHELVSALIPAVAAAVAQSLKATGPAAPASVDASQWDEFLAFQAWQKAQEVVNAAAAAGEIDGTGLSEQQIAEGEAGQGEGSNALSPEQDRLLWEAEATRLGIKADGRWSLERLRAEVEKKSTAA